MPTSTSHDFEGYVEAPRADEQEDGLPAVVQVEARGERRPDGRLAKGACTIPTLGGKAKKGTTHLSHRIDSATLSDRSRKRAQAFRRAACTELARTVGAGHCGVIASAMIKLAAESMALSEQMLDAGDIETHRKLADSSRMHMVYAREHCAKEAKARQNAPDDPHAAINAYLEAKRAAEAK